MITPMPHAPRLLRKTIRAILILTLVLPVLAKRTTLKPGFNVFPVDKDVEIGKEASAQVEKETPIITDSKIQAYITALGARLASKAPGEKYPYQFKVVNDTQINAFALPGGFIYVNRGIFESADNEAQLAGVMSHEISHVALRHGTNQMSKSELISGLAGAALKGTSTASKALQAGAAMGINVGLMRFSREAESQADLLGTQILYDSGYDPIAMPQFFQKLDDGSARSSQFFSDHPNPGNRITVVNGEIANLGAVQATRQDTAEFQAAKQRVHALPQPKTKQQPSK